MSKGFDLSNPLPSDARPPCAKTGIKVETHKDPVEPGKALLDLIHIDAHGPFSQSYDGAKYFVSFLGDWDEPSDILFDVKKGEIIEYADFELTMVGNTALTNLKCIEMNAHMGEEIRRWTEVLND